MFNTGRKLALGVTGLVAITIATRWSSAIFGQESAINPTPSGGFKPTTPRTSLMHWHDRAFDELLEGISRKDGESAEAAWLLAELANVNSFHSEKPNYRNWADQLRDGAIEIADTIRKKRDFDRAKALCNKLKDTCKRCHDAYKF
ncbi:MAG: cytochrome c [Phycisphaerales bacterium]|nr:cytochrome c [Phycisphaerales bacterium]